MSEQYSFPADTFILIGKITKAHGLNGEVKIFSLSGQPENFYNYRRLALVAIDGRMTVMLNLRQIRLQGKQVIAKLDTIDTKGEADLLAGMGVLLLREDLPEPADDEFYLFHLRGLTVKTVDSDSAIGTVESFFNNGAHDIMVVRGDSEEFLIPLINDIIVSYDEEQIVIAPPPGLLEINSGSNR